MKQEQLTICQVTIQSGVFVRAHIHTHMTSTFNPCSVNKPNFVASCFLWIFETFILSQWGMSLVFKDRNTLQSWFDCSVRCKKKVKVILSWLRGTRGRCIKPENSSHERIVWVPRMMVFFFNKNYKHRALIQKLQISKCNKCYILATILRTKLTCN